MCQPLGWKCRQTIGDCVVAYPLIGCEPFGPTGCTNCSVGLMATMALPEGNPMDGYKAPVGALYGYLVPGLGWVLTDAAHTEMQAGDVVLRAAETGARLEPVNEGWFASHWFDVQSDKPPKSYDVEFWRAGERELRTVTLVRV